MKTTVRLLVWFTCLLTLPLVHGASSIEGTTANVSETNPVAVVQIQRTGDLESTVSVDYTTEDGSATNGSDYVSTNGTLTFLPGISSLTVSITLLNDTLPEPGEYFRLVLANPTGGATVSDYHPRINVSDNDKGIRMSSLNYTNSENAGVAIVTVLRGEDENFPATVEFNTSANSAKAGTDYVATNGVLEFGAGELSKTVTIVLINDMMPESTESFRFNLGTVTGPTALGNPFLSYVRIVDNDSGIQAEQVNYTVRENVGMLLINITRGPDETNAATVDFATQNGTAQAGQDYIATNGTLHFAEGELMRPLRLMVVDDQISETNKYLSMVLSNPTGGMALGTNKNIRITILDDETPVFRQITSGPMVTELADYWTAAWPDFDNDGDVDLFVTAGAYNTNYNRLYRNDGNGVFTKMTTNEVGDLVGDIGLWMGSSWGDVDNDGDLDVFVCDTDGYRGFYRNDGGRFTRLTNAGAIVTNYAISQSSVWGDYDNDGRLDFFRASGYAGNANYPPSRLALYHNEGNNQFSLVTNSAMSQYVPRQTEIAAWGDYDDDGDLDLVVSDHGITGMRNILLFNNDGPNGFSLVTTGVVASYNNGGWVTYWGDFDNDGRLDLYVGWNTTSHVFFNDGNGNWTQVSVPTTTTAKMPAWGDLDNDGDLDLFTCGGQGANVRNQIFINAGNRTFVERTDLAPAMFSGRSAEGSWADYDNDGNLDLYVTHIATVGTNLLYHNEGTGKLWLKVKLVGTVSNRSGIGAKVRVKAVINGQTVWQRRDLSAGHRTQSDNDLRPHFGLGDARMAEVVRIEWPSGIVQELHNVPANQILTIPETSQGASLVEGVTANVNERNGVAAVQIQRTSDLQTLVNVDFTTEDNSAMAGSDYMATNGTLTFLPGVSNLTINIPLVNDALPESAEYFTLLLSNPTGGATVSGNHPFISITDNDSGIRMSSSSYPNSENAGLALVTVQRGEDEHFPATVTFYTLDSSAKAGLDYVATNGLIEFADNEFSKTVAITLLEDYLPESTEYFMFRLGTVTGPTALGTPNLTQVRILDNDLGINLEKASYWVQYFNGSITVGIVADPQLTATATVEFFTTNGTAQAGVDYGATNGVLTFSPGQLHQTVTIPILDDGVITANKSFSFRLGAVTGPTGLGTVKTAIINIMEITSVILPANIEDYGMSEEFPFSTTPSSTSAQVGANGNGRNAVFVFELPVLEAGARLNSATLSFYLATTFGSQWWNADLWGIAIKTNPIPVREYFEANNNDPGNTKLQDNILAPGAGTGWITSLPTSGLTAYLQAFYDANHGYQGGAFVFLRLNPDADAGMTTVGYNVALAESTTPPTLSLTITGGGLVIYQAPANRSVSLGIPVAIPVLVTGGGGPPYRYQWFRDETLMPEATNSTLVITNVQLSHAGSYRVTVTDSSETFTNTAVGILDVDSTFVQLPMPGPTHNSTPHWVDFDNDSWLELVITGDYDAPSTCTVFNNPGNGILMRNLTNAFATTQARWGSLAWADYDNDGDLDCFAGTWEGNVNLYFRNDGSGKLTVISADQGWIRNGVAVQGSLTSAVDLDNDGILDMVGGYYGNQGGIYGTSRVLRGLGNGRFEAILNSPLALSRSQPQDLVWVDYDNNGTMDLHISIYAADSSDFLFKNLGGGNFAQVTTDLTLPASHAITSAWGDIDNDGDFDVLTGKMGQANQLWRNLGQGMFEVDNGIVINGHRRAAQWVDYDNDGYLDIFTPYAGHRGRLFHNNGDGTLSEIFRGGPPNTIMGSICAAWGDYNNDGFMDLFSPDYNGNHILYRNNLPQTGNTNHWLKINAVGTMSNRSAVGAKIRLKATIGGKTFWQVRQIACHSHQSELLAHFGLGDATAAEVVRIEWPSGIVQELTNVVANQFLTITEPPKCVSPCVMNGNLEFNLTGNVGDTFELLETDTVDSTNWTVRQTVTLTNRTQKICEPASRTTTQKYYQIRRVP